MITNIAHNAVTVRDMEESIRFYTEAMGFTKAFEIPRPETGEPWIVYMNLCRGQFLELFYGGETFEPWNDRQIGFNHFCFEVDDIFETVERIRAAGYAIDAEPKQGADMNWQAWVKDPNGIRIELMKISPESPQAKYM
ncbi:MAG: VOC family protein [Clostridiales bacterium]|nr:VOC family protein [Clostridiales bacterium]